MELILASQSPYRRAQLEHFGMRFRAVKPEVDEDALKARGPTDLGALTVFLATAKAQSLRARFPNDVLLGSDQIAELHGQRLDKPLTRERAALQLDRLQGDQHSLITSLALLVPGHEPWTASEFTVVKMRPLSADDINAYLDVDQPLDCAGSYKIEKAGLSLIERVSGHDPSAIQGLPLILLTEGLKARGLTVRQFWR